MKKMQFQVCNAKIYKSAVLKHFARLSDAELILRYNSLSRSDIISDYIKNAEFPNFKYLTDFKLFPAYHTIFIVFNDCEYKFPHTLDNIIILPHYFKTINSKEFIKTVNHELAHIFFRYNRSYSLQKFCLSKNIRIMDRPKMLNEITNPDTYTQTSLRAESKIIFVALIHNNNKGYIQRYYCWPDFQDLRLADKTEIDYYDSVLPYPQNEHPEEILAYIVSQEYKVEF